MRDNTCPKKRAPDRPGGGGGGGGEGGRGRKNNFGCTYYSLTHSLTHSLTLRMLAMNGIECRGHASLGGIREGHQVEVSH